MYNFFSLLGLTLPNATYLAVPEQLQNYKNPQESLVKLRKSLNVIDPKDWIDRLRQEQASSFYELFQSAHRRGTDVVLAKFIVAIHTFNEEVGKLLLIHDFFMGEDRRGLVQSLTSNGKRRTETTDEVLAEIQKSWNQLDADDRDEFLIWFGKVFYSGTVHGQRVTIESNNAERADIETTRLVPQIKQSLEEFVYEARGRAPRSDLEKVYYRVLALKIMKIYELELPSESLALPSPQAPGVLMRLINRFR